jgi:hypothetical protein
MYIIIKYVIIIKKVLVKFVRKKEKKSKLNKRRRIGAYRTPIQVLKPIYALIVAFRTNLADDLVDAARVDWYLV